MKGNWYVQSVNTGSVRSWFSVEINDIIYTLNGIKYLCKFKITIATYAYIPPCTQGRLPLYAMSSNKALGPVWIERHAQDPFVLKFADSNKTKIRLVDRTSHARNESLFHFLNSMQFMVYGGIFTVPVVGMALKFKLWDSNW